MSDNTIIAQQCRGARGMLGWSQDELAKRAGVAKQTLADFERGSRKPYERTLRDIQHALETVGIEFIDPNGGGPGVRLKSD